MRRVLRVDARACRRRGAQKSKMRGRWLQIVLRCCVDVVELDLSFKTRIRLPPNSPGLLRSGSDTVFGCFWSDSLCHRDRKSPHPETHSKTGMCMVMQKRNKSAKESTKIGTPFCSAYLDCCERVRPVALIISAGRVGPAHRNLSERFKTGFRFWMFFCCICA